MTAGPGAQEQTEVEPQADGQDDAATAGPWTGRVDEFESLVGPSPLGSSGTATGDPLAAPIVVKGAPDQIVERLVTAVALGLYVPGQRLPPERDLAAMLKVSRTTVREALRRMTDAGYIEQRRGRHGGSYVLAGWRPSSPEMIRRHLLPSWDRFEALFDARQLVEPLIAATAARRRTDDDVDVLRQAIEQYWGAGDREASRIGDERLHLAVVEATHNPVLVSLSTQIRSRVSLDLGAEPYSDEVRATARAQHRELTDAIADSDADTASRIAEAHFALSERLIRDLVDKVRAAEEAVADDLGTRSRRGRR